MFHQNNWLMLQQKITHALIHLLKTKSVIRKITHTLMRFFKTKSVIRKITQIIYRYINSFIQNKKEIFVHVM